MFVGDKYFIFSILIPTPQQSCQNVEGSFYVSCTFETRLDVIRQRLVQAFSKNEVRLGAPRSGLQGTILPLLVCVQMLSPKSEGRHCKVGLFFVSTIEGTFLQFLPQSWLFLTFHYAVKFFALFCSVSDFTPSLLQKKTFSSFCYRTSFPQLSIVQ